MSRSPHQKPFLFLFLDEAGNFDFSSNGSKYFILSAVSKERPFLAYQQLTELKYDLVEAGVNLEYFHASEDAQQVRNKVFEIIQRNIRSVRVDSLVVEKRNVAAGHQHEERFYPDILGHLIVAVLKHYVLDRYQEVVVFTDQIPVVKKRRAVEKAVKMTLARMLPEGCRYRILHHDSKSNMDSQIADYCNWAVHRRWSLNDERSYLLIKEAMGNEIMTIPTELGL